MRSVLETDGYKFSMASAGFPLRREAFYYSHRKGGPAYLPVDPAAFVAAALPEPTADDFAYLDTHGYFQDGAFREAIRRKQDVRVVGLPRGGWFTDREPVLFVDGPSALPSWLEPVVLQLHLRIQIATAALRDPALLARKVAKVTCEEERAVIVETLDSVGVKPPPMQVASQEYADAVSARARELVAITGDGNRIFEVGMRAVSCSEQHRIALRAIRDAGILRTSNVQIARELDMIPVGTMGHEHVQRHGGDYAAYTSMRDRYPGFIFYLPDTYDTIASGIPAALAAMLDDPARNSGIRFDSEHGIRGHYLYAVSRAREYGLQPLLGLESGWNAELTREFEELRRLVGWPADRQAYGYGGYLVRPPWPHFGRDDVSAVWKLCQTGERATMKFGDEPKSGKASIPGRPVLWRSLDGRSSWAAQEGEDWAPPVPAALLSGGTTVVEIAPDAEKLRYSPATSALVEHCTREREASVARALSLGRKA